MRSIVDLLVAKGVLDPAGMRRAKEGVRATKKDVESVLIEQGVPEKAILEAKSELLGIPVHALENSKVSFDVLKYVPEESARHYQMVPLTLEGGVLHIGMINPENLEAREALQFISSNLDMPFKIFLISRSDFNKVIKEYQGLGGEMSKALGELQDVFGEKVVDIPSEDKEKEAAAITEDAPITKMVAVILRHAVEGKASDIHIEPLEDETRVRFRQDGVLYSSLTLPKNIHSAVISRIKVLSNLKIDETRMPQDGRFHTKVGASKIDFRVSSFPTSFGEKVALRILDPTVGVGTFSDLGLLGKSLEIYERAMKNPYGVVLITGPTGSGKSTTLYTTLNLLNKEGVNIITLEDPVEYYIKGVNQSQIKPEIGYTFASGLRSILRQDPNIIMVGEIRDKETAGLATHAALTGHLVFSTLHTNNALGIIPRLVDMEIDQFLIPSTLVAGVAQRLIKKMCGECAKPVALPDKFIQVVTETLKDVPEAEQVKYGLKKPFKIFEAPGCAECGYKGTKGRLAMFEIFEMTKSLEKVVLGSGLSESVIAEEAKKQGMITMKQDGIMKALIGLVSMEEVLRAVEE